jgi:hypothetical protein
MGHTASSSTVAADHLRDIVCRFKNTVEKLLMNRRKLVHDATRKKILPRSPFEFDAQRPPLAAFALGFACFALRSP